MEFTVEKWETAPVVYVRNTGPYGAQNKQAMEQMKQWAKERGLLEKNAVLLGIPRDDPRTTAPDACRYDACLIVDKDRGWDAEEPIQLGRLEAGDYAVFQIAHTAEAVQQAWEAIFPALQASGYSLADKPTVERYAEQLLRSERCELCVPIVLPASE